MKLFERNTNWLPPALASLALVCAAGLGRAQTAQDYIVNQFDDGTAQGWAANYGNAPIVIDFDPDQDRGPGASPGSLKVTIDFDLCAGLTQKDWERVLAETLDLTKYTKLHMSVKVDPSSSHLSDWGNGALGNLRPHIRLSDWGGDSNLGSNPDSVWVAADAYGSWIDYAYPIDQTLDNLATRRSTGIIGLDMWSGWGTCAAPIGHTNTVTFWVDNIWLEFNTNTAPPPPPTMAIQKAGPAGLQITMDDKTSQWQRNGISTPSAGGPYLWASQGGYPVSYSCTITNFPDAASHAGFEAHMYLANGDTATANDQTSGSPDWNVPDIFIFRLENAGAGARAQIQWKTNAPASNATNIPVVIDAPSALGTWTVTFTDSTHGALTGPGITATNFALPEDAVLSKFNPAVSFLQFGMFKNDEPNDGHNNNAHGTFSRVQFTGPALSFDDDFSGASLTNKYEWRATSSSAVQHIPQGTAWVVDWTLPADGFVAENAATLPGPWKAATFTKTYSSASSIHGLVAQSALSSGGADFFRMIKRPFAKLQVLMPGETAAPNTPTGKTGTPDAQTVGTPFNVVVNAVDEFWNISPSSDTIALTSTDGTATLPTDAALLAGTRTFSVTLNTAGTFTVTATDVTDSTKTASTGSTTSAQ